jgi:hypothetical protein
VSFSISVKSRVTRLTYPRRAIASSTRPDFLRLQASLTASDPTNGALLWNNSIRGNSPYSYLMDAVAALDGQRAYHVAPPQFAALDLVTEAFDWITSASFTGTPAAANGVVYAHADRRRVAERHPAVRRNA